MFKCKCLLNNEIYALKEIPKYKLFTYNKMFSILNEPNFLVKLNKYNFLPKIVSSFQDYDNFYLITTLYEGKSLNYFRTKNLSEEQIKFVSACVIQSLFYLRKEEIIHRDIMMKNIILDNDKYFNLIDFSFSIKYLDKNIEKNNMITYSRVTPPEILNKTEYDYNSDYYRLGSVIYFLIFKDYPLTIKKNNITNQFIINKIYKNYTSSCIDFLSKLLISDYTKRIGYKDIKELMNHEWFKGLDWKKLEKRKIKSPFKFFSNELNKSSCSKFIIPMNRIIRYKIISKKKIYLNLTKNFDYVNKIIIYNLINKNLNIYLRKQKKLYPQKILI